MADPGSKASGSTTTAPPPPPPSTPGSSSPSTTSGQTTSHSKPPPRVHDLKISTPKPGEIVLSWALVNPSAVAHVIVARGPAGHCPTQPLQGTRIGDFNRRTTQVDAKEHDTTKYCYAVFTLDVTGAWLSPVTHLARNKGDTIPPIAVTGLTGKVGQGGAVRLAWTNPPDAAHNLVVRGPGTTCPQFPADGTPIGTRRLREGQVDFDGAVDRHVLLRGLRVRQGGKHVADRDGSGDAHGPADVDAGLEPRAAPSQPGSSGSSLPDIVGIIGGGAIVLAGLAYATLRIVRREWEWHARTGYGIRDLMSVDVRDYDRTALVIPAIIGVCIAGAARRPADVAVDDPQAHTRPGTDSRARRRGRIERARSRLRRRAGDSILAGSRLASHTRRRRRSRTRAEAPSPSTQSPRTPRSSTS